MASTSSSSDVIITLPDRITVRHFRLTDVDQLAYHANNREVWNNLRNGLPHPYTATDAEGWIKMNLDTSKWTTSGPYIPAANGAPGGAATGGPLPTHFAICINDDIVGTIGLVFGDEREIYCRSAEIGYWLSKDCWGKGIMGTVAPAFVEWAWATFGRLVRINSAVMESNVASQRCLEKAGLIVEGRRKMAYVKNGVFGTEILMGMLRPDVELQE